MIQAQFRKPSRLRTFTILGAVSAALLSPAAHAAVTWRDLQFAGSASQGFLYSSDNDYLGDTSDGTFDFREYAANASWAKGQWRFGAQVFGQKLGDYGDDKIKLDWATVDFQPKQWFGVRAGRVKMPRGLYNEALDLDAVRPFVLLPQSVYDARLRDFNASFDGAMIYGNVGLGRAGSVDYRLFYGDIGMSVDSGANDYFNNDVPFPNVSIGIDAVRGGSLFWNTPVDGLRVGYSYSAFENFRSDRIVSVPGFSMILFKAADLYERQLISAEYILGDWIFAAEAGKEQAVYDIGVPGAGQIFAHLEFDTLYAYVSAARRINGWLELGGYYSYSIDQTELIPTSPGLFLPDLIQDDFALSARFDVTEHVIFKLEGHYLSGSGKLFDTPRKPQPVQSRDNSWTMIAAKVTFQF